MLACVSASGVRQDKLSTILRCLAKQTPEKQGAERQNSHTGNVTLNEHVSTVTNKGGKRIMASHSRPGPSSASKCLRSRSSVKWGLRSAGSVRRHNSETGQKFNFQPKLEGHVLPVHRHFM